MPWNGHWIDVRTYGFFRRTWTCLASNSMINDRFVKEDPNEFPLNKT